MPDAPDMLGSTAPPLGDGRSTAAPFDGGDLGGMRALGMLAGGAAQDFSDSLAPIIATAELVLEALPEDHVVRADVQHILDAALAAKGQALRLLAFSRRRILRLEVVDLSTLVDDWVRARPHLLRSDVALQLHLAEGLGRVNVDVALVHQALAELVADANDALSSGGVLTIRTAPYTSGPSGSLETRSEAVVGPRDDPALASIALIVSDNGTGMDPDALRRVFDPLYSTKANGTGLGLPTVRGIVKQHGGAIQLTSAPNVGTSVEVRFPCASPAATVGVHGPRPQVRHEPGTVLVVDDDRAVRVLVCRILQRPGYHVLEASDPHHALALAEQHGDRIDLLVTDMMMPQMKGLELFDRMRANHPALRLLLMSGYTEVVEAAGLAGDLHVRFLDKPFTVSELLDTVRTAFGTETAKP